MNPLVVHAGKRRWTAPHDLAGLLAPTNQPALQALRPRFTHLLDGLTQLTPGALGGQGPAYASDARACRRAFVAEGSYGLTVFWRARPQRGR